MASASAIQDGRAKSAASDTTSAKCQTAPVEAIVKKESANAFQDSLESSANKVRLFTV